MLFILARLLWASSEISSRPMVVEAVPAVPTACSAGVMVRVVAATFVWVEVAVLAASATCALGAVGGGCTTRGASSATEAAGALGGPCSQPIPGTQCRPENLCSSDKR